MWAGNIGVQDEESWFDAIAGSEALKRSGSWYELCFEDGTSEKFQSKHWLDKLKDVKFKERVLSVIDEEIVMKFENRTGDASHYYNLEED